VKKSREPQVGDHDHHSEQEDDGVVIDRGPGLVESQNVGRHHQAGPDDRSAGAIDSKARKAADSEDQVGGREDQDGNEQSPFSHRPGSK